MLTLILFQMLLVRLRAINELLTEPNCCIKISKIMVTRRDAEDATQGGLDFLLTSWRTTQRHADLELKNAYDKPLRGANDWNMHLIESHLG